MKPRERWFGATGRRVPEIALEGSFELEGAIVFDSLPLDLATLRDAHQRGIPVVVRCADAASMKAALSHPEVACVLVGDPELLGIDLAELTYG